MDKNNSLDWFKSKVKSKLDKGKNEAVRLSKIGKLRIEISSLNKKKEELMNLLGKKVYQLIEEGKISKEYFEPDFSDAVKIDENIQELIDKIAEINTFYDNLKYEEEDNGHEYEASTVSEEKPKEETVNEETEAVDTETKSSDTSVEESETQEENKEVIEMPPVEDEEKKDDFAGEESEEVAENKDKEEKEDKNG